jgi:hypothetical protein
LLRGGQLLLPRGRVVLRPGRGTGGPDDVRHQRRRKGVVLL